MIGVFGVYFQPRAILYPCRLTYLENFVRSSEADPRKETDGLPADAFGGRVTEDGEVKIRRRLRRRAERDELRFAIC